MRVGMYAGSFDPVTYGHMNIIERAAKMFDKLYVVVTYNSQKRTFFNPLERVSMIQEVCKNIKNVEVIYSDKLTVDCARDLGAHVLVRGLRAVTDFEYEFQMAITNHQLNDDIETTFLMTDMAYSYISSSLVREIATLGGDISHFVPKYIEDKLKDKIANKK